MKDWPIHMLIAAVEKIDGLCMIQIISAMTAWKEEPETTGGSNQSVAAAVLE
jgi:hypothetical protein